MKFGNQLKFNINLEWRHEYINYSQLKALIYKIERLLTQQYVEGTNERSRLLVSRSSIEYPLLAENEPLASQISP